MRSTRLSHRLAASALTLGTLAAAAHAQTLGPDFAGDYTLADLGSVPGVTPRLGGLIFKDGDPSRLLICGGANGAAGALYEIGVTRNAQNHVTGFSGTATQIATAANNDGGMTYAPNGTLMIATYPDNMILQYLPGATVPSRATPMGPLGLTGSTGGLLWVPVRQPGAGTLKAASYGTNTWFNISSTLDASGLYTFTAASPTSALSGGLEAFVYVPSCARAFNTSSILQNEYGLGRVSAYSVDANGNPIVSSRRDFVTGLSGVEGGTIDPLTGDFIFSTYGGGDRLIRIIGLPPPESCPCDWNGIDCVNSSDFFDFLDSFFDGDADINEDGHTDSGDFFSFLGCFFEAC